MSFKEGLAPAFNQNPNFRAETVDADGPFRRSSPDGFCFSFARNFKIRRKLRHVPYAPNMYEGESPEGVKSAKSMMRLGWKRGGFWLQENLRNQKKREAFEGLTDWSENIHQVTLSNVGDRVGVDVRYLKKARFGLNIGYLRYRGSDLYEFTTSDLMQLIVGAYAIASVVVNKSGR